MKSQYAADEYTVGKSIPKGVYKLYAKNGKIANVTVYSTDETHTSLTQVSNSNNLPYTTAKNYRDGNRITLAGEGYLKINNCLLIVVEQVSN